MKQYYDPTLIELLIVRLSYYYRAEQFDNYEFIDFCHKNYPLIKYSFDLGESCKFKNHNMAKFVEYGPGWLGANHNKTKEIFLGILSFCSILYKDDSNTCKVIEQIQNRISNKWFMSLNKDDKYLDLKSKNGGSHLIDAFIAGAMDISKKFVENYWQEQLGIKIAHAEQMEAIYSEMAAHYQEYPDEPLSDEDAVMSALENGNGEMYGF